MRQRGSISLIQVLIVLGAASALLATIWGAVAWHASTHFKRGETSKQVEWDKQEKERRKAERARADAVAAALLLQQQRADTAEVRAAENERRWKEARRANRHATLGSCAPATPPTPVAGPVVADREPAPVAGAGIRAPGAAGGDPAGAPGIRLHWRFVGLFDSAFTGIDGEPVYRAEAQFALEPSRVDTASPYSLDDVLDVNGENARALGECIRAYGQAMSAIDAAATAWDRASR